MSFIRIIALAALPLVIFFLGAHPSHAQMLVQNQTRAVPQNQMQMQMSFAPLVKKTAPSVVHRQETDLDTESIYIARWLTCCV